jgi:hypothetical protein
VLRILQAILRSDFPQSSCSFGKGAGKAALLVTADVLLVVGLRLDQLSLRHRGGPPGKQTEVEALVAGYSS